MSLPGVTFIRREPGPAVQLGRADVALFAGLVARDPAALPERLRAFLAEGGWVPMTRPESGDSAATLALLGLPVPVESWDEFTALYRWDGREVENGAPGTIPSNLGLAVRSFFAEGGRKAYVLRTGDPLPLVDFSVTEQAFVAAKRDLLDGLGKARLGQEGLERLPLLPGFAEPDNDPDPSHRETWTGAAALFGIEDVAMLLLPDLVELCAGRPEQVTGEAPPPAPAEDFKPCAPALPAASPDDRPAMPEWRAPRLAPADYALWSRALGHVLDLLGRPRGPSHRRDVILVGALPLPLASSGLDRGEERNPLLLLSENDAVIHGQTLFSADQIGNARLQLAYPWVSTEASKLCPEGVESPDGVFAGLLAKQALAKGAFHSAAGQEPVTVRATVPTLDLADLRSSSDRSEWLGERISLIGPRHGRLALLSDATMADSRAWRPGGVSRLMNIVLRAGRHLGQDQMFEPSGPQLWSRLRNQMERFLDDLAGRGALTAAGGQAPYEVRCDRTTMTQSDIDAGRAIMQVGFTVAYPVVRITVSLNLIEPPRTVAREAA
uniref:hypothetical protein n=1 Tax=Altererythrobacter segetis TaxID=1104773 RepID=UPI001408E485|nr:hypothetical protein [Altererythrobacter segetis]